jgi:DNA invertase Pin-like site-specific DNA recombinase
LAADTLVITKLDRLVRSLPDARDFIEDLAKRNVKLSIGASVHDLTDPVGRLLNVLAMVAEFESALIRARTRQGQRPARGKQPKLSKSQEAHLVSLYKGGRHTTAEIAELFKAARSTDGFTGSYREAITRRTASKV